MFTYAYAPSFNAGVQRPLKFAHYLPSYGYNPIIITAQLTNDNFHEKGIYRIGNNWIELELNGGIKSIPLRMLRRILYQSGIIQGYNYFWYKKVLKILPKIVKDESPDIIYATYPPIEPVMLGIAASKQSNTPLVVDFRDGFVFEPFAPVLFPAAIRNKRTEKHVVANCHHIIGATEPITNYFRQHYPGINASTITNGFDSSDWSGLKQFDLGTKINIVYTGSLSTAGANRTIEPLLKGIDYLTKEERESISVYVIGNCTERERSQLINGYGDIFRIIGSVPRREALRYQISADVLLLITGTENTSEATGKIFEYLMSARPILGITGQTVARNIIEKTGTGICVDPTDPGEIANVLNKLIKLYPNYGFYKPVNNEILKYSRKELTGQLAQIFDGILHSRVKG
jgi:glycosyltransferase involved in cell wall biosynthesis